MGIWGHGVERTGHRHWTRWAARLVIPTVMIFMAARAVYLSAYYNLSAWKGGGMGMFASADSPDTRFVRLYIEAPTGERHPLVRLSSEQVDLLRRAVWYPKRENFLPIANSTRATQWATNNIREKVTYYDSNGRALKQGPESFELLSPIGRRPAGNEAKFTVIADYFSLSYDMDSGRLKPTLVHSFRFDGTE